MTLASVLVTGATGNVGTPVVDLLVAAGTPVCAAVGSVRGLSRLGNEESLLARQISPAVLDFTDPTTWASAYAGIERMFLLRPPQLGKPKTQMLPSLEAAKAAGVQHVVFLSLQGAEGNRFVPHAAIEAWLRASGLGWTFIRVSFFMQNLTTTHLTDIRDRNEIVVPAGSGATAFLDAADVGAVAAAALIDPAKHHNRAWTATGPEPLTYAEVAQTLSLTLDRPIRYDEPGLLRYTYHARRRLGMTWGMVTVTSAIYTIARLGHADGLTNDVHEVTGRDPVSLADFAQRHTKTWSG